MIEWIIYLICLLNVWVSKQSFEKIYFLIKFLISLSFTDQENQEKKIKIAILLQFTRPAEESETKLDPKIIIYYKVYEHFFAMNNNFWILLYFTLLCRTGKLSWNCYFSIFSWFSWSVKESKIGNLLRTYTILYLALTPKHLKEKSSKKSYSIKSYSKKLIGSFREIYKMHDFS